jgi:hypothetical protein
MLLSFSVANYRSFDKEQLFSMVASRRTSEHPSHCRPIANTDESALCAAIFYGANGAGKSNFVRAIAHFRTWVLEGTKPTSSIDISPFLLRDGSADEPTRMEMRLLLGDRIIVYGFKATSTRIIEETLVEQIGNTEKRYFYRGIDEKGAFRVALGALPAEDKSADKLKALSKVGPRKNQLFLTSILENVDSSEQGSIVRALLGWLRDKLHIITPESKHAELIEWLADNSEYAKFVSSYVREAGTGISKLSLHVQDIEDTGLETMLRKSRNSVIRSSDGDFKFDEESKKLRVRRVLAEHDAPRGRSVSFPISEESDGTRRLLHLLPAIFPPENRDSLFLIDEIDRSLHPLLAKKFIENFLVCAPNTGAQMVVTTHDTNLLDLACFRRDEIWFADKNQLGATEIYPLTDFKVRKDLNVDTGYLAGRFGGVPYLGGLDRLLSECPQPE